MSSETEPHTVTTLFIRSPGASERQVYALSKVTSLTIDALNRSKPNKPSLSPALLQLPEVGAGVDLESVSEQVEEADVVIVDLTEGYPAGTYALGFCHAQEKPVIPVADTSASSPFLKGRGSLLSLGEIERNLESTEVPDSRTENPPFGEMFEGQARVFAQSLAYHLTHVVRPPEPFQAFGGEYLGEEMGQIGELESMLEALSEDAAELPEEKEGFSDSDENVPASVYLPDEPPLLDRQHLETAIGEFMEAMGFVPEQEEEPQLSSWFKRLWFKTKKFFGKEEVHEAYEDGYDALKAYIEGSTAAEQTSELGGAAAQLIGSLENTPSATIRLGNLILLKQTVDGESRIHIETVSPSMMRELENRDLFERDPKEVKNFIDERQSVTGPSEPDESEREPRQLSGQSPPVQKTSEGTDVEASES